MGKGSLLPMKFSCFPAGSIPWPERSQRSWTIIIVWPLFLTDLLRRCWVINASYSKRSRRKSEQDTFGMSRCA